LCSIVVDLQLDVLAVTKGSRPAAQNVSAGKNRIPRQDLRKGRRVIDSLNGLTGALIVQVALQREGIALVFLPIGPEAALHRAPMVIPV
jgi:hypothetical protein